MKCRLASMRTTCTCGQCHYCYARACGANEIQRTKRREKEAFKSIWANRQHIVRSRCICGHLNMEIFNCDMEVKSAKGETTCF